ncbi:MAG: hypothetical protein ACR2KJ_04055 [Jatrophihabitans sp.]
MIDEQIQVLVTVKAYPQPSRTSGETVCVAGMRTDTEVPTWIRIYPPELIYCPVAQDDAPVNSGLPAVPSA